MSQPLHVSLGSEHGDFIGISHLPAGAAAFPGTVKLACVSDCARATAIGYERKTRS